jgi:hypothetical protein
VSCGLDRPDGVARPGPLVVVHLRTAEYSTVAGRHPWHAAGLATLPPMECHPAYVPCPHCSDRGTAPEMAPREAVS